MNRYKIYIKEGTHTEESKEGTEEEWNCIKELLQKTAKEVVGTKNTREKK